MRPQSELVSDTSPSSYSWELLGITASSTNYSRKWMQNVRSFWYSHAGKAYVRKETTLSLLR